MTATPTPCLPDIPDTDRFARLVDVPDPPTSVQGRRCYWDDTVQEAVGELRRRMASTREAVVTMALDTVVKLETTRMRHGRPVSGTQVSNVHDGWDDSLPKLAPLPAPFVPRKSEPEASATEQAQPVADASGSDQTKTPNPVADASGSDQTAVEPVTPIAAGHEAGATPSPQPVPAPKYLTAEEAAAQQEFWLNLELERYMCALISRITKPWLHEDEEEDDRPPYPRLLYPLRDYRNSFGSAAAANKGLPIQIPDRYRFQSG